MTSLSKDMTVAAEDWSAILDILNNVEAAIQAGTYNGTQYYMREAKAVAQARYRARLSNEQQQ